MTRNILIIIFFFCLILSNLCCAKKSTIVTKNGFDANSSFSSSVNTFSPIEVSVHISANKENSDVRITYTPQKELDLVRVEFNG